MPLIETHGGIVDSMRHHGANSGNVRDGETPAQRVGKQVAPQPNSLERLIHRKTADQEQRYLLGHATSELRGWKRDPFFPNSFVGLSGVSIAVEIA